MGNISLCTPRALTDIGLRKFEHTYAFHFLIETTCIIPKYIFYLFQRKAKRPVIAQFKEWHVAADYSSAAAILIDKHTNEVK